MIVSGNHLDFSGSSFDVPFGNQNFHSVKFLLLDKTQTFSNQRDTIDSLKIKFLGLLNKILLIFSAFGSKDVYI